MWLDKSTSPFMVISKPRLLTIKDIDYPKVIFTKYTEAELNTINIFSITEDLVPNSRYYTHIGKLDNDTVHITKVPIGIDVETVKALMLQDIANKVKEKQKPLDVFYIRNLKGRKPIPVTVQQEVSNIYSLQDIKEAEIGALRTLDECILYEATPYDYIVTAEDVTNDIDGTLIEGDIIPRLRNSVTDW